MGIGKEYMRRLYNSWSAILLQATLSGYIVVEKLEKIK